MHSFRFRLLAAAVVVAGVSALSSCGGGGGGGETPAVPEVPVSTNARYQILLLDAATGSRITDPINVSFSGAAALTAADGSRLNGATVTTSSGIVPLDAEFTAAARTFSVQVADAGRKGWIPTGTTLVGKDGLKGDQVVELKMVSVAKAAAVNASPAPVAMAVQTGNSGADGRLTAPVAVGTTSKTVTNAEGDTEKIGVATLRIDAGVKGTAPDGSPAAAGPLTVSSTYYANASAESMSAFPGGFAATVEVPAADRAVLNGNAPDNGVFVTGGFAQFNVTDSAGKPIKNFDRPVTVGIDLPRNSKDADGNLVRVGSEYPVWSYDDATGKWVFEKMGIVAEKTPVDPDNFTVQITTRHLSSWNLDYFVARCTTATLNLVGRPSGDARPLAVEFVGVAGRRWSYTLPGVPDSNVNLYNAPADIRVNVTVRDRGRVVGQARNVRLCGVNNLRVTLPPVTYGRVQVDASESCASGGARRPLPTYVYVESNAVWSFQYATPVAGTSLARSTFASVLSGPARIWVYNPRTWSYETRSVTVPANGTLTQTFNFTVPCGTGASGG